MLQRHPWLHEVTQRKQWQRLFEELGGEVRLSTPVQSIEVESSNAQKTQHRVTDGNGNS